MISRFDLYDFVANLMLGLVFLWCLQVLAGQMGWSLPLEFDGGLAETSILVALGYITGLLLQGLSQGFVEKHILKPLWKGFPSERWLLPEDKHFSHEYKERLLYLIANRFKVAVKPNLSPDLAPDYARELRLKKNRELFYLCYHDVGQDHPRLLTLNAQYGLFRGLLTMFSMLTLFSLVGLLWSLLARQDHVVGFGIWSVLSAVLAVIAYARCKKRGEDFAQSVFYLFMVRASNSPSTDEQM